MRSRAALPLLVALMATACSAHSATRGTTATTEARSSTSTSSSGPPSVKAATKSAAERAADAYVWGYPLVVTERTLDLFALRVPVNHLLFQPALAGVASRSVVAPNTDTLYAIAPLDLRSEPYVLTLPAIHDRYYAFQFISAYTDSFAYVGTRATGGRAGRWAITAPGWKGTLPAGVTRISSPTPQLVLLGRFLVTGAADVARIHTLAQHVDLQPLSGVVNTASSPAPPALAKPAGSPQSVAAAGAHFFDELGDALAVNPPVDPQEVATMRGFADLGIGPGRHPGAEATDRHLRASLAEGVVLGERQIDAAVAKASELVNGWSVAGRIGAYGHDALLRAEVAKSGWGANVAQEAVYAHSSGDVSGAAFTGARDYVVHFASGQLPPVNAFWSVTMYGPDRFFIANPIDRYAVGDRTPGLQYGKDGSLDIYVQNTPPAGHEANWLPAPTGGFSLSMRLYLPKSSVLDGHYVYPTVELAQP